MPSLMKINPLKILKLSKGNEVSLTDRLTYGQIDRQINVRTTDEQKDKQQKTN